MNTGRLQFSIMFFSASEESLRTDKYRLVLEAARFADKHEFSSVWVPERHFASLGGLYPNPAVLQAALAAATQRVGLRAGSVVLPIHDPLRVTEEWSMVDNLSNGRVGVSFASGWNPADFVFFPDHYAQRQSELFERVSTVQRLWRGETAVRRSGDGAQVEVAILPRPIQSELPTWITAARSPETFVRAGEIGANVLTHLLDQDVDGIAHKVELYRNARARAGFDPNTGVVTAMVHTFLAEDDTAARELARKPYCEFLKSNAGLLKGLAASRGETVDLDALSPTERDAFVNFLYDRFVASRALIGSPASCRELVNRLWSAGVDELACLLDFGPEYDAVLGSLPYLDELRQLCSRELPVRRYRASNDAPAIKEPPNGSKPAAASETPLQVQARCAEVFDQARFYEGLERRGVVVEGECRAVQRVWRRDGEAIAELTLDAEAVIDTDSIPPALLDACLQVVAAAAAGPGADAPLIATGFSRLEVTGRLEKTAFSHVVVTVNRPDGVSADVRVLDAEGKLAATITGVSALRLSPTTEQTTPAIADWLYELAWQGSPDDGSPAAPSGSWLVFADATGVAQALVPVLEQGGASCRIISRSELFGAGEFTDEQATRARIQELVEAARDLSGVIHLWSLDTSTHEQTTPADLQAAQRWGTATALMLIQALIASKGHSAQPKLFIGTRGAQPVRRNDELSVAQSPIWGLGRTCAMEHPEIWGGLIDLDPSAAADAAAHARALCAAMFASDQENQVAFRDARRYVARLMHREQPQTQPLTIHGEGTYLVTGGLWGLGLEVARWLVRQGARNLVLLGRTALPPRHDWAALEPGSELAARVAAVTELEAVGATVLCPAVDVADGAAVRAVIDQLASSGAPPVRGVVHAASVWRDADGKSLIRTLAQLDISSLERVFGPKVLGSWVLHEIFANEPLDFFVLFSSAASLTGSAGQGNYAAASTFLDALAHLRHRSGLPALCVNWGPVAGAGFGATADGLKVHQFWESNGLKRIDTSGVLQALEMLIPSGVQQLGVMNVDWQKLQAFFPALLQSRWASNLVSAPSQKTKPAALLVTLNAAPAAMRRELLRKHVQDEVRRVMRLERLPDPKRRLFDLGMDSLMALDMKTRLQEQLGADIPVTAVFNYPTIDALVGYLAADVLQFAAEEPEQVPTRAIQTADPLARIKDMSDEEAEQWLAEKFASGGAS